MSSYSCADWLQNEELFDRAVIHALSMMDDEDDFSDSTSTSSSSWDGLEIIAKPSNLVPHEDVLGPFNWAQKIGKQFYESEKEARRDRQLSRSESTLGPWSPFQYGEFRFATPTPKKRSARCRITTL